MEKLVDDQDVLPFQPTGSGKFESFASGVSDNQSTMTKHWVKRPNATVSQIDVSPSLWIATAVSGKAGQIFLFKNELNCG